MVNMRDTRLRLLSVMPTIDNDTAIVMQTDAAASEVMKLCADLISEYRKGELPKAEDTFVVRKVRKRP